eukprot:gene2591-3552_t
MQECPEEILDIIVSYLSGNESQKLMTVKPFSETNYFWYNLESLFSKKDYFSKKKLQQLLSFHKSVSITFNKNKNIEKGNKAYWKKQLKKSNEMIIEHHKLSLIEEYAIWRERSFKKWKLFFEKYNSLNFRNFNNWNDPLNIPRKYSDRVEGYSLGLLFCCDMLPFQTMNRNTFRSRGTEEKKEIFNVLKSLIEHYNFSIYFENQSSPYYLLLLLGHDLKEYDFTIKTIQKVHDKKKFFKDSPLVTYLSSRECDPYFIQSFYGNEIEKCYGVDDPLYFELSLKYCSFDTISTLVECILKSNDGKCINFNAKNIYCTDKNFLTIEQKKETMKKLIDKYGDILVKEIPQKKK